jgi:Fic/DOC family protein
VLPGSETDWRHSGYSTTAIGTSAIRDSLRAALVVAAFGGINSAQGVAMLEATITLTSLLAQLRGYSIEQAYDWLGFDYGRLSSSDTNPQDVVARQRFLSKIAWRVSPSEEHIRRLFNQINTYYAERWCLDNAAADPAMLLLEINRIALYRHGKHLGLRSHGIEFGIRVHLDVLDPWRKWPWLRGGNSECLAEMIADWCKAVASAPPCVDNALALAMAIIAIHPFSDANGRTGRLVLSWLCRRWGVGDLWLDEARDGEVLRTGRGLNSTEYLMASFIIRLMGRHNIVAPGTARREQRELGPMMREAMRANLDLISQAQPGVIDSDEFLALKQHWEASGHLRTTSPRFECLGELIR